MALIDIGYTYFDQPSICLPSHTMVSADMMCTKMRLVLLK